MNKKYYSLNIFKEFKVESENWLDKCLKVLQSNQGGEYMSNEFEFFRKEHEIIF